VAISNHRLVQLKDGKITFRWKDYRHGNRVRLMTLDAPEFIRRFLLHVLPQGFMRLRHTAFWATAIDPTNSPNAARCSIKPKSSTPSSRNPKTGKHATKR